MPVRITRILTHDEYSSINEDARSKGYYYNDRRIFLPGWAWYEPWYFDPTGEFARNGGHQMYRKRPDNNGKNWFLSQHYWDDWSDKRPPICVVCPNGEPWEIDRKSRNGTGWRVTGILPNITCEPSIVVDGYHGYLRNGEFTADLEGRGDTGLKQYE